MALFKILRGGYQNKPELLNDGWAYFTPDNKGFYIDVVDNNIGGFAYNNRIKINERVYVLTKTLYASDWNALGNYGIEIDPQFTSKDYTVSIEPIIESSSVKENFAISSAVAKANLFYALDDTNSRIYIVARGIIPTIDIPVKINLIPKEVKYITFTIHDASTAEIDSGPFIAVEGMTLLDWCISPYNTSDWYISGGSISYDANNGDIYSILENPDSAIIDNYNYSIYASFDCCFVAGTQILTDLNGTTKAIETINVGDQVISYNIDTDENYKATVVNTIINRNSKNMAKITFDNKKVLEMTNYHPLYTIGGWKSITGHMGYNILQVGDVVKTSDGWSEIIDIFEYQLDTPIQTYTLDVISPDEDPNRDDNTNDSFYANGMVVHNAACPS